MGRMPLMPDDVDQSETSLDERGIRLDVWAHHHDVAGLEGGIVGQQAEEHLAQHLHLARRAMAGMELHRADGRMEPPPSGIGGLVGGEIGLQPPEQSLAIDRGRLGDDLLLGAHGDQCLLELPQVTAQAGKERMHRGAVGEVVTSPPYDGRRGRDQLTGQCVP